MNGTTLWFFIRDLTDRIISPEVFEIYPQILNDGIFWMPKMKWPTTPTKKELRERQVVLSGPATHY